MPFFIGPAPFMLMFGWLSAAFWLILLGVLVWLLIRWLAPRSASTHTFVPVHGPGAPVNQLSALEILRQRYARGEINAEEFDHMRERLEGTDMPAQQAHL